LEAKELRIGNLVQELGDIVTVGLDTFKHYKQMPNLMNENIKPIPLTDEWLIKFGFEWVGECSGYFDTYHAVYLFASGTIEFHPYCTNDEDLHLTIKYVHQLQNIYFALTNQELTIK
jgi:hypothetical protein